MTRIILHRKLKGAVLTINGHLRYFNSKCVVYLFSGEHKTMLKEKLTPIQ